MARTKAEVRQFLDSLVGHVCVDQSDKRYNGQCVCLIKNLMDFLGVPNPYAGRGNAITAGDAYIAQNIGEAGRGWLTVCVNRDMGRLFVDGRWQTFGHIWADLKDEANYESNGAKALTVTKNTRPISQAQQFVNFDKWIEEDDVIKNTNHVKILFRQFLNRDPTAKELKDYASKDVEYFLNKVYKLRKNVGGLIRENETLKKQLAAKPVVVDKAVVVDYINKNLK